MPFPMVHLCIARGVLPHLPVSDAGAFYLGALAPDSVHFRDGFVSDDKVPSHLCPEGWTWAGGSDEDAWQREILRFYRAHREGAQAPFIQGYAVHTLTDCDYSWRFWMPFVRERNVDIKRYSQSEMHQDGYEIDSRLHASIPQSDTMWALLSAAKGVDIPGVVSAEETDRMIASILHEQYKGRMPAKDFAFHYVSEAQMRDFIDTEATRIAALLREASA